MGSGHRQTPVASIEHKDAVRVVAFSPDGKTLATATQVHLKGTTIGEAQLWDVATGQPSGLPCNINAGSGPSPSVLTARRSSRGARNPAAAAQTGRYPQVKPRPAHPTFQ